MSRRKRRRLKTNAKWNGIVKWKRKNAAFLFAARIEVWKCIFSTQANIHIWRTATEQCVAQPEHIFPLIFVFCCCFSSIFLLIWFSHCTLDWHWTDEQGNECAWCLWQGISYTIHRKFSAYRVHGERSHILLFIFLNITIWWTAEDQICVREIISMDGCGAFPSCWIFPQPNEVSIL